MGAMIDMNLRLGTVGADPDDKSALLPIIRAPVAPSDAII